MQYIPLKELPLDAPDWQRRALELEAIDQLAAHRQPHIDSSIVAVSTIGMLTCSAISFGIGHLISSLISR